MKKVGRKVLIPAGAKFSSTLKSTMPRSQSTLALQRKGSNPGRLVREAREQQNRELPPALLNRTVDESRVPKAQPFGVVHRHRLSVDGTIGLQALLHEQIDRTPNKTRPVPKLKSRGASLASNARELLKFVRAGRPDQSMSTDLMDASLESLPVGAMRPTGSRAVSRARLRMAQSMSNIQLEGGKVVQRVAFRSQTGSINGKPKRNNQDSFLVCQDYGGLKQQWLFGVFDGHGLNGHDVSAHIKKSLPQHLLQFINKNPKSLAEEEVRGLSMGFSASFLHVNHELMRSTHIDSTLSGSTAVAVLMRGDLILCANAGDSRAIVGRLRSNDNWVAIPLSKDHKPDDPVERARIEHAGGRVEPFQGTPYHRSQRSVHRACTRLEPARADPRPGHVPVSR